MEINVGRPYLTSEMMKQVHALLNAPPFFQRQGETYFQCDEIRIERTRHDIFNIEFRFKGVPLFRWDGICNLEGGSINLVDLLCAVKFITHNENESR